MYIPEYSISPSILKNIANIEYAKAVVENTPILDNLSLQLAKHAKIEKATALLQIEGYNFSPDLIKKRVDGVLETSHIEIENILKTITTTHEVLAEGDVDIDTLKSLHMILADKILVETGSLRNTPEVGKVPSEEILAKLYDTFDWFYSKDGADTHPVLSCSILLAQLLLIKPFKKFNQSLLFILAEELLALRGYTLKNYASFCDYFFYHIKKDTLNEALGNGEDLTSWLEFVTEGMSSVSYKTKDEVLLSAKDTKLAKATGLVKLTERQNRIVEYLQDYGILRNKDFKLVFPTVSEDSVLRDLKSLQAEGVVVKTGSTKSSSYVLK